MNSVLKNPFPDPETLDKELNQYVKKVIVDIFNAKGSIKLYDFIKQIEEALLEKKNTMAKIISYYCANAIINEQSLTSEEKISHIGGILREIIAAEEAEGIKADDIDIINDIV